VRRHPALQELSRDHQHALAVALKARRAEPGAREALREFLDTEGYAHLALEEREIFPWIEEAMPEPALDALGRALR
jgi:hypothetical protein